MSILVEWDCGCIGFHAERADRAFIVRPCDGDRDDSEYFFGHRNMSKKECEELDDRKEECILLNLKELIIKGYRYEEIKRLLHKD